MSHAVPRKGEKSPYRRNSFALFAFLAWILLPEVRADQASVEQKYPFTITETKLGPALLALCNQAQHQCLFPYELAQSEGVHPVIGNYTVTEALTIMLSGTNFSGGLTQRGIITVSRLVADTGPELEEKSMSIKSKNNGLFASLVALFAGASPAGSVAQETSARAAEDRANALEEVIVSGTKRDGLLQDTGAAVSVFTETTLENQRITRPADFIAMTPNAVIREGSHANQTYVTIRGDAQTRNTEAPVAVVIDGVLRTGRTQLQQELYDVQQIEVFKGPQGFLYGRNAIAGAIVINTKKPDDEWSGKFNVGYGYANLMYSSFGAGGAIVKNKLFVQIGASYRDHEGYYMNITREEKIDPEQENSGRIRLLYDPIDSPFSADLRLQVSKFTGGSTMFVPLTAIAGLQRTPENANLNINDVKHSPFVRNADSYSISKQENLSLKMDYSAVFGTFTSVTSYDNVEDIWATDNFPYFASQSTTQFNAHFHEAVSQEIRFISPSENRFRYIFGAYYLDINDTPNVHASINEDPGGFIPAAINIRPSNGIPNDLRDAETTSLISDDVYTEAWALFANIDYDLSETLQLTLGGRYDEEKKRTIDRSPDNLSRSDTFGLERSDTYSSFQPKVGLTYQHSDALTLYASYARGFQAGGFNVAQAAILTEGTAKDEFGESTADNFEVGFKVATVENKLRLAGALFHNTKKNAQQFIFVPTGSTLNAVIEIDEVRIVGGELEASYQPTSNLTIDAAIGYLDAEVKEFAKFPELVGNEAPFAPNLTGSFALTHFSNAGAITPNGEIISSLRYEYMGTQYPSANNINDWQRDPVHLLNAKITLQTDSGWSLSLWGKNLLGTIYPDEVVPVFPEANRRLVAVTRSDPRIWSIELGYRF